MLSLPTVTTRQALDAAPRAEQSLLADVGRRQRLATQKGPVDFLRSRIRTTGLALNPCTELVLARQGGEVVAVTTVAPVRGQALRVNMITREREPAVFDLLRRVAEKGGHVTADLDAAAWQRLVDIGFLVPGGHAPRAVWFRCPPRDPPRRLIPRRAAARAPSRSWGLQVNPTLRHQDATRRPEHRAAGVGSPSPFASGISWIFVDHPDAPVASALSAGDDEGGLFRALIPGAAPPSGLDPELRRALVQADVFLCPAVAERRRRAFERKRAAAARRFRRDGHVVVDNLIHPTQLAAVRRYYRELIAEGHVDLADEHAMSRRYRAHDEILARVIHRGLTALVGELAGAQMVPSYSFLASYRPGATLPRHRDRPQCAITVSLLIDYRPEPDGPAPWAIHLKTRGRHSTAIRLGLGAGLFFRGTQLTHWRDRLPDGHHSTSLLLHYVPTGFRGSLT
jgi:hypothetical protein